jgi:hypothetical protein
MLHLVAEHVCSGTTNVYSPASFSPASTSEVMIFMCG